MMRRKKPAFTRIVFIVFTLVVGLAAVSTWLMIVRPNEGSPPKQAMLRVPSVTGLNLREAAAILGNSGLRVGRIEEQTVDGARAGTVIAQLPQPEEMTSPNTAVNLVVQVEALHMPSVIGFDLRKAAAILDNSGLRVGRIEEQTVAGARVGTVIAQLPQPGERVSPKTAVNLVVQISSSPHLLVDQILESLDWGNIAFNLPLSMGLQETTLIELLVGLRQPMKELSYELEQKMPPDEQIEIKGARIRVSNRMEARLTGTGFQITEITPEMQAVGAREVTEWKWQVKAILPGMQSLHLTLAAILSIDGNETPRAIRTFDKKIEVKVSWSRKVSMFVSKNWQWIWAAILLPFVGWTWRRWRKSKGVNKLKGSSNKRDGTDRKS